MASFVVNELLCFLSSQYDKLDRENINSILLEFYILEELECAKQILISECEKIDISEEINEFKRERKNTRALEIVKQKVLKDIIDIWEAADVKKGCNFQSEFVASDPCRLPSVNADKFNLKFLISSILTLKEHISTLNNSCYFGG